MSKKYLLPNKTTLYSILIGFLTKNGKPKKGKFDIQLNISGSLIVKKRRTSHQLVRTHCIRLCFY